MFFSLLIQQIIGRMIRYMLPVAIFHQSELECQTFSQRVANNG